MAVSLAQVVRESINSVMGANRPTETIEHRQAVKRLIKSDKRLKLPKKSAVELEKYLGVLISIQDKRLKAKLKPIKKAIDSISEIKKEPKADQLVALKIPVSDVKFAIELFERFNWQILQ